MNTITWRSIRRYPVRFALAVLAVALGVAFVGGTLTLQSMLSTSFASAAATSSMADGYVRGVKTPDGARGLVPLDLADDLAALPEVSAAVPAIQGPVVLLGADGDPVGVREGGTQRPGDQGSPAPSYATVVTSADPAVTVTRGTLPAGSGEVTLSSETAEKAGLDVGDDTRLVLAGQETPVRVVGVVDVDGLPSSATVVGIDEPTGVTAFAASGLVPRIAVVGADEVSAKDVLAATRTEVEARLADDSAEVVGTKVLRDEAAKDAASSMEVYTMALTLFAVVSVLVGAFIIANTFSMTIRGQLRQTAVLRALGANSRQVVTSILIQATAVGVLGSVLGIGAGYGVVALLRAAIGTAGLKLDVATPVEPATIAACLIVGIVVSVVSALWPARRAARIPPVAAMRDQAEAGKVGRVRTIAGAALLIAGIAATVGALFAGVDLGQVLLVLGVLATPTGALLVAPAIMPAVLGALARPAIACSEVVGSLARGNATRNPRRSASTATALMIGMTLVGAVCVFASSSAQSMRTELSDGVRSDFVVQSAQGPVPGGLVAQITDSTATRVDTLRYATLLANGTAAAVGNLTDGAWNASLLLSVLSGGLDSLDGGQVAVQETFAAEHDLALGDDVELTNPATRAAGGRPVTARIGAIIDSGALGSQILVPGAVYEDLVPAQQRATGTVFVHAPAGGIEALRGELETAADPYLVVQVDTAGEYVDAIAAQFEQLQVVLYAMLGLSLVVALLGIANLLALSVAERTREIGMLRAIGLGRGATAAAVLVESSLVTLFGAVVGLAVGVGVTTPLATVFKGMGITHLSIPWGQLAVMFVVAALAGMLAAVFPAVRAARLPVLRAVTED